jgi:negative regulator of flagellin synthesis FlgM
MDIRSSVDSLKTLLGATQATPAKSQPANGESAGGVGTLGGDRATLSSAGSEVSQAASASEVRMDKVAAVQSALAAGTYNVPASAVAGKVVDSMLTSEPAGSE